MSRKTIQEGIQLAVQVLSRELLNELERKKKRLWVRKWIQRRDRLGASENLLIELANEDQTAYRNHLRLSVGKFEELLEMVSPRITKKNTRMRMAIPARTKLEITLRYLASGDSLHSLQYLFRIPTNTICCFLPYVLTAVFDVLAAYIKVPDSEEGWNEVLNSFQNRWNFPNCCGALDGKHVQIRRPPGSGSRFFNYKGNYSIVLFALVDADYCFKFIDIGSEGRASDSTIFRNSTLNIAMEANLLNWPQEGIVVGDDAFPLKNNLMKPFSHRNLTVKERIFNYRRSRARRVVENAFGILASRFRIFLKPIDLHLKTVDLVVKASCALHNWLRITSAKEYLFSGSMDEEDVNMGEIHPGTWRNEASPLRSVDRIGSNNSTNSAAAIRENYSNYFVGEGSVSWQERSIGVV